MVKAAASLENPARIITIGSIDAFHVPQYETFAYSSSKAAVHQLARHLAKLLAQSHITSNVVAPGMFPSKMTQATIAARGVKSVLEGVPHLAREHRSEEHTSELQSPDHLVCRLLL